MRMKNPAYPGRSVRYDYWDSVAEGAKVLSKNQSPARQRFVGAGLNARLPCRR